MSIQYPVSEVSTVSTSSSVSGGAGHGSPGEPLAAAAPGPGAARAGGNMNNTHCDVKL